MNPNLAKLQPYPFERLRLLLAPLVTSVPEGGFYCWSRTPLDDEHFASALYREYNVTVLPGSYLARSADEWAPAMNAFARSRAPTLFFVRIKLIRTKNTVLDKSKDGLGLFLWTIVDCARTAFRPGKVATFQQRGRHLGRDAEQARLSYSGWTGLAKETSSCLR